MCTEKPVRAFSVASLLSLWLDSNKVFSNEELLVFLFRQLHLSITEYLLIKKLLGVSEKKTFLQHFQPSKKNKMSIFTTISFSFKFKTNEWICIFPSEAVPAFFSLKSGSKLNLKNSRWRLTWGSIEQKQVAFAISLSQKVNTIGSAARANFFTN